VLSTGRLTRIRDVFHVQVLTWGRAITGELLELCSEYILIADNLISRLYYTRKICCLPTNIGQIN
jgi:hypothetical protein